MQPTNYLLACIRTLLLGCLLSAFPCLSQTAHAQQITLRYQSALDRDIVKSDGTVVFPIEMEEVADPMKLQDYNKRSFVIYIDGKADFDPKIWTFDWQETDDDKNQDRSSLHHYLCTFCRMR